MKPREILTAAALLLTNMLYAQEWIGSIWTLDTSITLGQELQQADFSHLKYKVCQGTFYYVEADAFQRSGKAYSATIHALSLYDYAQAEILLSLSEELRKPSIVQGFWINDLDIQHDRAVISVQDRILLYHKDEKDRWQYDTLLEHPNVKVVYIHGNDLYYFEEQHDFGYQWFRRSNLTGEEEHIRALPYEAPHVVQASPNRYLFHDTHFVYYLSTRFATMSKYHLDGRWAEDIHLSLPNWHPFEDTYLEQALSVPYGIERIHATMADIFSYSYPKIAFPIGNALLLYYTQYEPDKGKSKLQYALSDSIKSIHYFTSKDSSRMAYTDDRFPFNLLSVTEDKAHTTWNDLLIELTAESDIDWKGLTPSAYQQEQERFYRRYDPLYKIRIMRYKNNTDKTVIPFLLDEDRQLSALNNISSGKSILLVNNTLECSGCRNTLLDLLNTVDSNISIGILHSFVPGALQEREMHKLTQAHLSHNYHFYFLATGKYRDYPTEIIHRETTFPALLFCEPGKAPILFSTDQIFEDDITTYRYRETFLQYLDSFLQQQQH